VRGGFWTIAVACLVWCAAATADPVAPKNTAAPVVSGVTVNGHRLSVSNGTWSSPNPPLTYSYQWDRCNPGCVPIKGATASSYTLTASDVNATIQAIVIATDSPGNATGASSNLVGPVGPSAAQIVASLSSLLSPHTTISALLRRGGYPVTFKAPAPGTLTVTWTSGKTTVAAGHVNFTGTGRKTFTVRLTTSGRRVLATASKLTLTARANFTPSFSAGAASRKTFRLGR
jgi:hypothetical protein